MPENCDNLLPTLPHCVCRLRHVLASADAIELTVAEPQARRIRVAAAYLQRAIDLFDEA